MMKTKVAIAILVAAGLAGSPLAAEAKSHKHSKHHMSTTTGANMKSDKSGGTSNADPGTAKNNSAPATTSK